MKKQFFAAWVSVLLLTSFSATAGDAKAGLAKSKTCAGCHGQTGISNNDNWPNLAGQKKAYLIKQLKDFKSGVRKDAQMGYWSKTLSDKDMEDIAEYYSTLGSK